jgi:hypothetical protein
VEAQVRRRRRIAPRSEARDAERDERAELVRAVLARDWLCMAAIPPICTGVSKEVNEIVRRSQWAAGYLVDWNCEGLCHNCHAFITTRPNWALRHGHQLLGEDREDADAAARALAVRARARACAPDCEKDHR